MEARKRMARLNDNLFTTSVNHAIPREMGCQLLTRFGWVRVQFTEKGLSELVFDNAHEPHPDDTPDSAAKREAQQKDGGDSVFRAAFLEWLKIYEAADSENKWSYLDLAGTDFQKSVWQQLLEIPFGECTTYGAIADAVGRPKAHRAVGTAVGANPVSMLVPCHRVLPSTGKSGNYRWGADRKVALLDAEQASGADLCALFA